MKDWYQRLSQRERAIVLGLAVLVAATLAYVTVIEPIRNNLEAARLQVEAQRELLGWMRGAAAEAGQLRAAVGEERVAGDDRPAYLLLDEAIRASGLPAPSRIEPQGGGTQAQFESVAFDRLIVLLDRLARQRGLEVTQASFTRKAAGEVGARITLEQDAP